MNVLGINIGHDTSSALIKNGKVVAACEQERYNKKKHTNEFPLDAIKDCLRIGKLKISDLDIVSVGFLPKEALNEFFFKPIIKDKRRINFIADNTDRIIEFANLENIIREKLNYKKKIEFNNHHFCHLASAYYPSGFKKSLVISYDGLGENQTGQIGLGKGNKIEVIYDKNIFPHSLGLIYAAITFYLGWKPFHDEGIVMGLAPLGNPHEKMKNKKKSYIEIFRNIIKSGKGLSYSINTEWTTYHYQRNTWLSKKFFNCFGKSRKPGKKIYRHHKNIAAALQLRVEEIVLSNLRFLRRNYKLNHLCIAGGVGLNCSLNGKIHDLKLFKKIFVQPASGDSGLSYGTAIVSFLKNNNRKTNFKNRNFYLGSRFTTNEIKKCLVKYRNKINFVKKNNIFFETAKILKKGFIVAWFQDAAEFGPRALGNRSILCKPYPMAIKDHVNKYVKFRESFRPFAPAILKEYSKKFFYLNQSSDHMLIATKVQKSMKKKIEATVHVDNSCRVQTVDPQVNKKFYNLINNFKKLTNIPVLLNTSFNVKGQPIVNSPDDAILCFLKYRIDYLIIDNFLIKKKIKN